ncbi:MAG: efflux RND transporter periplasmic adaptor subunit [Cyclobacteriaceae bacterium]|nr:efflux RND transporter periplasmic adaptor subunit [Cyclobacteriaceae bacterium]MCH8517671.1 efflux RND transporter periplasmic adaptor subunit [Cyclobacteriaceae bacterium]
MNNQRKFYLTLAAIPVAFILGLWLSGGDDHDHGHDHSASSSEATIYTCSMHPQIEEDGPGKCPLCAMDLTPKKSGGGSNPSQLFLQTNMVKLSDISTILVGEEDTELDNARTFRGRAAEAEGSRMRQTAHFSGRIEEVFIDYDGAMVKKGQALATLYSPDLIDAQQELLQAARFKEEEPQLYRAIRSKLRQRKISEDLLDEIEREGKVREVFTLKADQAGYVSEVLLRPGDYVEQGAPFFQLAELSKIWVWLDVYESEIDQIQMGMPFEVKLPDGSEVTTKVSYIAPRINDDRRVIPVRLEIANPNMLLRPGMYVTASPKKVGEQSRLFIPSSAVLWTGKRSMVFEVHREENGFSYERKEIEIGGRQRGKVEVLSGLERGTEIVRNGTFVVDAASELDGKSSMMTFFSEKRLKEASGRNFEYPEGLKDKVGSNFKRGLDAVLDVADEMYEAFVVEDIDAIEKELKNMQQKIAALPQSDAGEASLWSEIKEVLLADIDKMLSQDLEGQRQTLVVFSPLLYDVMKYFGLQEQKVYYQFCPMANQDQGAYWVSKEEGIRNPYYGDMMLTCGYTEETSGKE